MRGCGGRSTGAPCEESKTLGAAPRKRDTIEARGGSVHQPSGPTQTVLDTQATHPCQNLGLRHSCQFPPGGQVCPGPAWLRATDLWTLPPVRPAGRLTGNLLSFEALPSMEVHLRCGGCPWWPLGCPIWAPRTDPGGPPSTSLVPTHVHVVHVLVPVPPLLHAAAQGGDGRGALLER